MRKGTKHLYAGFRLTALDISTIVENYKKNIKTFKKNEVIMHTSCREDLLGVVIRGTAYLVGENEAAQRGIIECFETGDLFSRKMLLNLAGNIFYVISKYPCEIALINYNQLADCCTENHPDSTNILDDMLHGFEKKMSAHIYILQQRTIREKLLLYFGCLSERYNANHFILPLPFTDLADYLSVDRSAMMREIKKLNHEQIIKTERRNITLLHTAK
ncbi:Crp/Fnr family transcriptional regulator [Muricomes intestini]|uniref:Crp/Fnr family transcriptional regulator n=2 Tax=Muricomes intestini TaxID=1796634 RepID=UPI002FE119DB